MVPRAQKDSQLVTKDWQTIQQSIEGIAVREVLHVLRDHGVITEIFRPEWDPSGLPIVHIYQSRLFPGAIGAWSCHAKTIDRLFVNQGHLKIVLYDGREGSPTQGQVMELYTGDTRPCFLVIPSGVWHGLQNLGAADALVINCPTNAYNYEDPDHYRLPYDSPEIPYAWTTRGDTRLRSDAR
ncbi:MAG: dTDP-4-dehydrorhamnose 3,5-epimerase [Thermoanaerobaculia bacterium]|jgi:dTDP-4-dehydrorhamnose 3,5-epimerase|nr:dTDP-4-dehydrorhamnose 3,5-epimerase [Thermoanaerobaculia bacterium]